MYKKRLDMESGEDVAILNDLGLNVTQAKIYLSIARAKILTANETAKISGVARPHVYKGLRELEDAGLVIRIIDQPERFQAIPIDECISNLMRRRITKTAELHEKTRILSQNLRARQSPDVFDASLQFMLIPKRDAVYTKAEKMIKNVQESIDFLGLTRRMISWLSNYSEALERALALKVECRMIMPKPRSSSNVWLPVRRLLKYPNFALRLISEEPHFGFSIWDGKEILMTTVPNDSPTPATTLWSNKRSIVSLCVEHFRCLWDEAEIAAY